jgi:PAS domain S-box-containing protein
MNVLICIISIVLLLGVLIFASAYIKNRIPIIFYMVIHIFLFQVFCDLIFILSSDSFIFQKMNMQIQFTINCILPVICFYLVLYITGYEVYVNKYIWFPVSIIPFISIVLIWTNDLHHLFYKDIILFRMFGINDTFVGIWFYLYMTYSYMLIAVSLIFYAFSMINASSLYRKQTILILSGFFIPFLLNIMMTFGVIDRGIYPIGYAFTAIFITMAIYKYNFLIFRYIARHILFDQIKDSILVLDNYYRIVDFNPGFVRIFNLTSEKIINKHILKVFKNHPADIKKYIRAFNENLNFAQPIEVSNRIYDVRYTQLKRRTGEKIGKIIVLHDTSELQELERNLMKSNRELEIANDELEAFSHSVAHDLKNPLSVVVGFSDLLKLDIGKSASPDVLLNIDLINKTGMKMTAIINELLILSGIRIIDNIHRELLDMAPIVNEALDRLQNIIVEKRAEIILPPNWLFAAGYSAWLEEIWFNYINNALNHGGYPPKLEFGSDMYGSDFVRYWVKDNGYGLTKQQCENIYDLSRVKVQGQGLGLSIVKRIVGKLGGEVNVESKVGNGSTFWFTLPVKIDN